MCPVCQKSLMLVPVVALLVAGLALAGSGMTGSTSESTPSVPFVERPAPAAAVNAAPEGLSPAATTRDWTEVAGSARR